MIRSHRFSLIQPWLVYKADLLRYSRNDIQCRFVLRIP